MQTSPSGVLIINDSGRGHFEEMEAGIFIPATQLHDAADFAEKRHMHILGGTRPVMAFDEKSDMSGLGTPTAPAVWSK